MDKKQQNNQIKKYIRWGCLALAVLLLAVMPLLAGRNAAADGPQASILTATADTRDITTQLIGGGQLSSDTTEAVTVPAQIKLTKYLVKNGDRVQKGDPIARVDKVSVMTALQEVQETLDYLSKQLAAVSSDTEPGEVKAQSGGVVKAVYGQPGDDVREVMVEYGALAVISLDGRMAVEISCETELVTGDAVEVTLSDGTVLEGRVETNAQGLLTVSVEDDSYPSGMEVSVAETGGKPLGTGPLTVHSPWNATAYSGTITAVNVSENTKITSGKILFRLETSGHSTEFQILSSQRQEYEILMQELFSLYDSGVVTAPYDGLVTGVDGDADFLLDASALSVPFVSSSGSDSESSENDGGGGGTDGGEGGKTPPSDGEGDGSGEGEIPTGCSKTDGCTAGTHDPDCPEYQDSETPSGNVFLVEAVSETGVTLKYISGDNDHKPTDFAGTTYTGSQDPIAVGDLVLLTADNVITKIGTAATQNPGQGQMGDMDLSGLMGSMGGMSSFAGMGGMTATQTFTLYSLEEITVATVTSQEHMSLEITVDEQDISRLRAGMEADITVEAMPGQTFRAAISAVGNTGTNSGGSSKFTVKLMLDKSGEMLPGMHASAYLDMDTAENVLSIPVAALVDKGSRTVVYTGYDEKNGVLTGETEVTAGISDGESVQILSGLSQGDTVYYAYYDTLDEDLIPEMGLGF